MNLKTRICSCILALALCIAMVPAYAADVEPWYAPGAEFASEQGLLDDTGLSFAPDENASRALLVTAIWRLDGAAPAEGELFTDVAADQWYSNAAQWAGTNGIVNGYGNGKFGPTDLLTREQFAVMLWRYAGYLGMETSAGTSTSLYAFNDAPEWSAWAEDALAWAVGAGLLRGTDQGLLDAKGPITQAMTFTMLARFYALQDALSLWTPDAPAKTALTAYMAAITDPTSEDFIPVEDRIAVFDLDGTLFCETDPNYFDYTLLKYRVLEDPGYKDKASDFEKEVANKIKTQNETGQSFSGLEMDHGRAVASAFAGMTIGAFNDYIQEFKKQPMPSYDGMLRGDGWYLPMLEVVNYLKDNDFTVYVVSGTDRLIVRGIVYHSPLNLPNRQIIGSDETIVSSNQGDADGLDYVFTEGEQLILGGEFLIKNLKMNKVSVIMQEIGQQPVLSFGNSTGDSSMAEYVTSGNPYPSLAFMLCCDDTERENGNETKAQKMFDLCEEFDWVPISMKNDWSTIYGNQVTKRK